MIHEQSRTRTARAAQSNDRSRHKTVVFPWSSEGTFTHLLDVFRADADIAGAINQSFGISLKGNAIS